MIEPNIDTLYYGLQLLYAFKHIEIESGTHGANLLYPIYSIELHGIFQRSTSTQTLRRGQPS
jgi:hypothetical protein